MKKTFIRAASLLLICITMLTLLASCTVEKAYPGAPKGMRPCNDGSEGVVMYVPINWSVDYSTGIPTAYFSYTDSTMINMVTVSKDVVGQKKPNEYFDEYKEAFASTVKDFNLTTYSESSEFAFHENISDGINLYEYRYSFKVATSSSSELTYNFAQALFRTGENSDLYIITYGTTAAKFDSHLEDLTKVYQNLKIVTEPISMGEDAPPKPEFSTDNSPEGFSAITAEYVDYILYVPSSWTPTVNTGMTAASKADDKTVIASVTAFNPQNNDNVYDDTDYDSFFASTEKTIKDTFGNISFPDENKKYEKINFEKQTGTKNATARKYVYTVKANGTDYTYEQYIIINDSYFYVLTMSCKTAVYEENKTAFAGIADNFKFKD